MSNAPKPESYPLVAAEESSDREIKPSPLRLVSQWLRQHFSGRSPDSSLKEALEEVLHEHEGEISTLAPEEETMIRNMLSFGEITVNDIMVPRTDIVACEYKAGLSELLGIFMEQAHTRLPVYEGTFDTIRGFIHLKDLVPMIAGKTPFSIQQVLRNILFVPPSMRIVDLLIKMRLSGVHMAIVVDEYGGTDGLVTMEDLMEEIVGEIQDEHDEDESHQVLVRISGNVFEADARIRVEKLEQELHIELINEEEEEDYDTLGGLIFFHMGRVPAKGEVLDHPSGLKFEIVEADPRRIRRVRIVKSASLTAQAG